MKILFEEKDFDGAGQMIIRNSFKPGSTDYAFGITVAYKMGWLIGNPTHVLLISLADGTCKPFKSINDLCKYLNEDEFGFRPMSKEEIHSILVTHGSRFRSLNF